MRLRHLLPFLLLPAAPLAPVPAVAQQQGQQWFIPGQQQGQRPPAQAQQQRPPQAQQRPANQRPPAPVIAIVDIPEVQRLSAAFNQVREEIERRRVRLNEDLQQEQGRWREEQQALAAARATLPPESLRERERALQERITDAQRIFRDRNRTIDAAAQVGLQQLEQAMGAVVRQVATTRGVNLVLPRQLAILSDPVFDVTDEVSAQLNRVLRTVNLPAEGEMPAPPPAAQGQQQETPPPPPPAPQRPAAQQQPRRN
ncbi:OmpH family outer membrane protein [Roseomonas sp. AR75]|uniref:OmpH family outer membrane protein n=1 Tax=Roseomonas sp. AR75 TaxID=2562311 RepID=UPI0010BF6B2B|nr:OmpH family outer membrane protein [Roseomonas sp. AR75]